MTEDIFVFDIQRASLHDGPGIRTTVFFKGCPLRCAWCHNPESQSADRQLKVLEKRCRGCGECVRICPNNVHSISRDGIHRVDFSRCTACGQCVSVCLYNALSILGGWMDVEDVIRLVKRDKRYYKPAGALTISGGEPLMQAGGCAKLLRRAKQERIHTCLDTSGHASKEALELVMPDVDIFLFDYKMTDPKKHLEYTGAPIDAIVDNLDYLCKSGAALILRCPIIPGINDDDEHLAAIARLSRTYDEIMEVNIMAYHDIAKGKIDQVGYLGELLFLESMTQDKKAEVTRRLEKLGCRKLNQNA